MYYRNYYAGSTFCNSTLCDALSVARKTETASMRRIKTARQVMFQGVAQCASGMVHASSFEPRQAAKPQVVFAIKHLRLLS